ncbi:MAG: HAD family hydrolase [Bacteroidales bacterium]|nr:HAD family hydrolase [Bacteroidales bacterium]
MSKPIKAVIFDLDGTLLNTLNDISEIVNSVLELHHFKTFSTNDYKQFIGNGLEMLCRRALPKNIDEYLFKSIFVEVKEAYNERQNIKTKPFDGVIEMLANLQRLNISIAVLSNKPHEFVKPTIDHYFPNINFSLMYGARKEYERKPDPTVLLMMLNEMSLKKDECLYVGDTETDILTAKNAGVDSIAVLWGFRSEDALKKEKPNYTISKPKELIDIIEKKRG